MGASAESKRAGEGQDLRAEARAAQARQAATVYAAAQRAQIAARLQDGAPGRISNLDVLPHRKTANFSANARQQLVPHIFN